MSDLRTIVYVSTATQLMSPPQLESLLTEARNLNLQNGVTGVLLYSDGNFIQCFEGSEASMDITYKRILNSRRHRDIVELMNEPIACRSFPDWQMAFAIPTLAEFLMLSRSAWKNNDASADPQIMSPSLTLLQGFVKSILR